MKMKEQNQVNCTNFLSLLLRVKERRRASKRSGNTKITDLLAVSFSGHYSLHFFILIGIVIRNIAGPAIVFSIILSSAFVLLSSACYAEFGSRFKREGSSYFYTYSSVGELFSFLTGWTVLFSYMVTAAAMGRGISEFIDSLVDGAINKFNSENLGTEDFIMLGSSLDLLASVMVLLIASAFASLVRNHKTFVSVLTRIVSITNLLMMTFLIITGFFYADANNWTDPGMFLPYGKYGVLVATAICFSVVFSSESVIAAYESSASAYTLPLSLFLSAPVNFLAFVCPAVVVSFMLPYDKLTSQAPLVNLFTFLDFKWARYMVAILGISSMLLGLMEMIYRMGYLVTTMVDDGLLPWFFAATDCREISVTSYIVPAFFAAILALLFDQSQLIDTLPIGPLLVTCSIATAVILVRYIPGVQSVHDDGRACPCDVTVCSPKYKKLRSTADHSSYGTVREPTGYTYRIAFTSTVVVILAVTTIMHLLVKHWSLFSVNRPLVSIILGLATLVFFTALAVLIVQPKNGAVFPFMVPFTPLTPVLLISLCIVLMLVLPVIAWLRFLFWFFVGLFVYFLYGVHHSSA